VHRVVVALVAFGTAELSSWGGNSTVQPDGSKPGLRRLYCGGEGQHTQILSAPKAVCCIPAFTKRNHNRSARFPATMTVHIKASAIESVWPTNLDASTTIL